MRLALALYLLCPAFWPGPGNGEHPTADRAACSASGACYSLHHATIKRRAAQEACSLRGGTLSTVHWGSEMQAVLALLRAGPGPGGGSKDLLFWVALERGPSHCTLDEPLKGFSWLYPEEDGDSKEKTLPWVEEPQLSCTVRKCAGLQVTRGVEAAGWKEMRCHLRANGYLCKYQFEALCPMPRPGAATNLSFRAPFQLSSSTLDFSPPGTEVSVVCPGDLSVLATCIQEETSARWDGLFPGTVLCPCSGRYLRAGKCVELPDCLDSLGGFACECAAGFRLGKDRRSCEATGEGQPTVVGTKLSMRHESATPASPVTDRTWPGKVHEKLGEKPQVTGQDSFATSIPEILQWGTQSTLPTVQKSPQTKPKVTVTPSGSVITTLNCTSSPSVTPTFDASSTVVFILVSIAVIVLVILTMTVLGLFKLCFHRSPSSRTRKGALDSQGVESNAEVTALSPNSTHCTDNGVKVGDCGLRGRAEGTSLAGSSLGSGDT